MMKTIIVVHFHDERILPMLLDEIDIQILTILAENSRIQWMR